MAKRFDQWILVSVFLVFALLPLSPVFSATDPLDVQVLEDLYRTLYYPSQLTGWNASGGDPCEGSWRGISCSSSSVISIKLNGLSLGGSLGGQLVNLLNLKELDISFNNLQGEIPYLLPPNSTHIDFSCNNFSQSLPYSLESMKHLRHINLSHNALSGSIGNIFTGLQNLRRMDLSYNSFTGDLPSSFANLTNLTALFLQNNKFTGVVTFLGNLHLTHLNIQNNNFSGPIPEQFHSIPNLVIAGNGFQFGGFNSSWNSALDNAVSGNGVIKLQLVNNLTSSPSTKWIIWIPFTAMTITIVVFMIRRRNTKPTAADMDRWKRLRPSLLTYAVWEKDGVWDQERFKPDISYKELTDLAVQKLKLKRADGRRLLVTYTTSILQYNNEGQLTDISSIPFGNDPATAENWNSIRDGVTAVKFLPL